jgi:hypothetical protein
MFGIGINHNETVLPVRVVRSGAQRVAAETSRAPME